MKKIQQFALLAVFALALGAVAQQTPPAQGGSDDQNRPRHGMPSADDQLKMMTERLNLTSDQQSKIKPILEETYAQWTKITQDQSLSREDKMAKVRSLHESASAKVRALLTDDQKKKFDEMMQEHMQQRGHGSGHGAGEGNPK